MGISGAVIVGGASGLGRATAESLAARGANVAILDRTQSDGKDAAFPKRRGKPEECAKLTLVDNPMPGSASPPSNRVISA
jgi:NAD(P)-dependent dehydrogenase (short-subunit alcohol dehydrogenase family)